MADVPGECADGSGGAQASGGGGELVFDILRRRLMVACARGGIPGPPPPSRASEHPSEAQVLLRAVLLSREALAATDRLHAALSLSAAEPHGAHLAPLTRPNTPPCSAMPPRALETVLAGSVFSVGRSPSPHLGLLGVAGVAPGRNHNRIEAPPLLACASSAPPEALPVALPARPPIDVEDASRARTRTHGERNGNRDRLVVAPVWRNDDDDDDDDDDDEGGGRVPGWNLRVTSFDRTRGGAREEAPPRARDSGEHTRVSEVDAVAGTRERNQHVHLNLSRGTLRFHTVAVCPRANDARRSERDRLPSGRERLKRRRVAPRADAESEKNHATSAVSPQPPQRRANKNAASAEKDARTPKGKAPKTKTQTHFTRALETRRRDAVSVAENFSAHRAAHAELAEFVNALDASALGLPQTAWTTRDDDADPSSFSAFADGERNE